MAEAQNTAGNQPKAIDDENDVADSWEDLEDDESLDRDIEQRQAQYKAAERAELEKKRTATVTVCQNSIEGQYKPQLKILRRQVNENDNQESKQTQVKSLEERQVEYMKARERILGSSRPEQYEYSDEEDSGKNRILQVC